MAYDYQAAISAGANPSDVVNYLAQQTGYNAQGAISAGANQNDVLNYMANMPTNGSNAQNATSQTPTNSSSNGNSPVVNGLESVGNFLFPIVSDVYHDIKGDNKKTFLQQAGDTALSALPFIPGLGEAGDAARAGGAIAEGGADIVADTAGDAATSTAANTVQKTASPLSKFIAKPVVKGAITGYGAGVASNLSQGQGIGQAFIPNVNNVAGAVLGGATPALFKVGGSIIRNIAGVDPVVLNTIRDMSVNADPADIALKKSYETAALNHATSISPSVENVAASNLDAAANQISKKTDAAGVAVGAVKQASGSLPLSDVSQVANNFSDEVAKRYGYQITSDPDGNVSFTKIPGRMVDLEASDMSRLQRTAQQLNQLGQGATVGQASDVISNIDNGINAAKDAYGRSVSPIDQLMISTRSALNNAVGESAPDLAAANKRFSNLKNLQSEVQEIAGNKLQRGELLMRRVFGNNSKDALDLFQNIKNETGIDLVKHATFAKAAIDAVGSTADKSALQNMIDGAVQSSGGNKITGAILGGLQSLAKNTIANPERITNSALKGAKSIWPTLVNKAAIEGSRVL